MYEEVFEEFQLTVVELPIEFVDDLPVYRGHLKELTFLSAEASSRKKLYQQLLQDSTPEATQCSQFNRQLAPFIASLRSD